MNLIDDLQSKRESSKDCSRRKKILQDHSSSSSLFDANPARLEIMSQRINLPSFLFDWRSSFLTNGILSELHIVCLSVCVS